MNEAQLITRAFWTFLFCLGITGVSISSEAGCPGNAEVQGPVTIASAFSAEYGSPGMRPDSLSLTSQVVEDWVRTRIEVARLQNRMEAEAGEYEDVVQAFYEERKKLLTSSGWTVENFEEAGMRIQAAASAMNLAEELEESEAEHEEEVAEIRASEFYTEQQKREIIEGLKEMRSLQAELYIEPARKDWPAVRPHRELLEKLTAWIAGNAPEPPEWE